MQEYLKKYPWLRGYNCNGTDFVCAFNWIPKGWVIAFGEEMCQELDVALRKTDAYEEAYVSEMKEKYGQLRMSIFPSNDEIEDIISKYTTISEHVCMFCGAVDISMLLIPSFEVPVCKSCYELVNLGGVYRLYEDIAKSDTKMPNVRKWKTYSKGSWHEFEEDISETVNRIREKAKREGRDCFEG